MYKGRVVSLLAIAGICRGRWTTSKRYAQWTRAERVQEQQLHGTLARSNNRAVRTTITDSTGDSVLETDTDVVFFSVRTAVFPCLANASG